MDIEISEVDISNSKPKSNRENPFFFTEVHRKKREYEELEFSPPLNIIGP